MSATEWYLVSSQPVFTSGRTALSRMSFLSTNPQRSPINYNRKSSIFTMEIPADATISNNGDFLFLHELKIVTSS